jgi:hypothetical protein
MVDEIYQPIFTKNPEPGHALKDVLTLQQFIDLLKEEEDYYPGEQHNTKLMITRLRKIFYDKWGWNNELIKGAAKIETRYDVIIVDADPGDSQHVKRYKKFHYDPKYRSVVYTKNDKVYGDTKAGQPTFIYAHDHQEVVLPDGHYCDVAHLLAGIDAANYRQVVTPLPSFLSFLEYIFPNVGFNMDMATWLGDIGSSSGDFLLYRLLNGKAPDIKSMQHSIDVNAPGSDMLGNLDAYAIRASYDCASSNGMRFTDIMIDYYFNPNSAMKHRASIFAREIGLGEWDGDKFTKQNKWMKYYKSQLRNETSFQVFSVTDEKIHSIWLPLAVWLGFYPNIIRGEELLLKFIASLGHAINNESNN